MTLHVFFDDVARRERRHLEENIALIYAEYVTLQHDLTLFEQRYLNYVVALLLTRDELLSRIAALDALTSPHDPQRQHAAETAAARSQSTQNHVNELREAPPRPPVTAEIKDLFREAAKRLHPDKGHSPEDRERRTAFMASVNTAYIAGDAEAIRRLLGEFQIGIEATPDNDSLSVDAMNVLRAHLNRVTLDLDTLRNSDLAQLCAQAQTATDGETGFLEQQHRKLSLQITTLQERLNQLTDVSTPTSPQPAEPRPELDLSKQHALLRAWAQEEISDTLSQPSSLPFTLADFADNPEPRLLVLLLIANSTNMTTEQTRTLNETLLELRHALASDALVAKRAEIAVVGLSSEHQPMTFASAETFRAPEVTTNGATSLSTTVAYGLDLLETRGASLRKEGIGLYRPVIILFAGPGPLDDWQHAATMIQTREAAKTLRFFSIGLGNADMNTLSKLSRSPHSTFQRMEYELMFKWWGFGETIHSRE